DVLVDAQSPLADILVHHQLGHRHPGLSGDAATSQARDPLRGWVQFEASLEVVGVKALDLTQLARFRSRYSPEEPSALASLIEAIQPPRAQGHVATWFVRDVPGVVEHVRRLVIGRCLA